MSLLHFILTINKTFRFDGGEFTSAVSRKQFRLDPVTVNEKVKVKLVSDTTPFLPFRNIAPPER